MNKEELLKHLTSLDFMAIDLALYCDTHPSDRETVKLYNDITTQADKLRYEYEQQCGPLTSFRSKSGSHNLWTWIDNPWPWQKQFNYKCCEEN